MEREGNILTLPKGFDAVMPIAHRVSPDEKAWALLEVNVGSDYRGMHRVQIIYVNRGDKLARWAHELGPVTLYNDAPQLHYPLLWEHTVAEAQDMAEQSRADTFFRKFIAEKQSESTLITDFLDETEARWKTIRNQSVYGPHHNAQRGEFSRAGLRNYQEARRGS